MNLFAIFADRVHQALARLHQAGKLAVLPERGRVVVEPPRDPAHGDIATNAAMMFSKEAGLKPRDLAELLVAELKGAEGIAAASIAGPGFINLRLTPETWTKVLAGILAAPGAYGRLDMGRAEKVNVEYVSANPTGPMHVGHCRGAIFGDALASLLANVGYAVTREYYINDAGAQVDVLARSAFLRYREALGEDIGAIPEGLYPGDYLVPVGKALVEKYGATLHNLPEAEWLAPVRSVAIDMMMAMIRADLAALNIEHEVFFSERSLSVPVDRVAETIAALRAQGDVYDGRLPPPKGQPDEDWEDREQTLFRSTKFGDDVDRPLIKSDGSYTYFAADIAYHADKYARGFTEMINVLGADHGGYVKRMQAAVAAVSGGKASFDAKLCQLVRLLRNGEPVKMSKRSGEFVTLREVVDEVGSDAARFMMLMRKNDATLDFDLAKVIEQSKDNPVFYVQYAHARASSILRNAREAFGDAVVSLETACGAALSRLDDEGELKIIRLLAEWPRLVEAAARAHEPHRLAFYLYELASALHAQWNRGKDSPYLRFIIENDRLMTEARLALVLCVRAVIASGLAILGVSAPEEMR